MRIGIAGAGRVAQAMGRCLRERGFPIDCVAGRDSARANDAAAFIGGETRAVSLAELHCEFLLIAVPDRVIGEVAGSVPPPRVALHTCGAYGGEILAGLRERGASVGALHPLQTFASAEAGWRALPGSAFAVDGDPEAMHWAEEIATRLEGSILRIPAASRAIYHAAAVMASNHLIAVMDAAILMMIEAGVNETEARVALAPIARAALANALDRGTVAALTGPVERGDAGTVRRHLEALRSSSLRSIEDLYRAAATQALSVAVRRGLNAEAAGPLKALLNTSHV